MSSYSNKELFDSKTYFTDNRLTCWMACLMAWTKVTPFDHYLEPDDKENFQRLIGRRRWLEDEESELCQSCSTPFSFLVRKHHCRLCGQIFCGTCSEIREYKCCYRENLFIRTCGGCHQLYQNRWQLFHRLQKEWVANEGRASDVNLGSDEAKSEFFTPEEDKRVVPLDPQRSEGKIKGYLFNKRSGLTVVRYPDHKLKVDYSYYFMGLVLFLMTFLYLSWDGSYLKTINNNTLSLE